eukprot:10089471-Prorocentrum_lima.AAC.1
MWNPPEKEECITFEERSVPSEHPDSLMTKLHEHDTQGDEDWERFYLGVQTEEEIECPLEKPIIIDHARTNVAKINTVKCKEKYWIEPSGDGDGPAELSDTLQWGVP